MKIKYAANIISISRILLSIVILLFMNNIIIFSIVYILCGVSDILDGFIARKTSTQSILGAKIDSIADCVMYIVIIVILLKLKMEIIISFIPLISIIFFIRIINLVVGVYKYKTLAMIHTIGNKITGLLVFATPIVCVVLDYSKPIIAVGVVAVLSALEEFLILITSTKLDVNRKSIFK